MGSVIVDIMAGSSLAAEHKKLHPFFTAPKAPQPDSPSITATDPTVPSETAIVQDKMEELKEPEITPAKRKRRKAVEEGEEDCEDTNKPKRGRPKKIVQQGLSIMEHFSKVTGESKDPGPAESTAVPEQEAPQEAAAAAEPQVPTEATAAQDDVAPPKDDNSADNHNGDNKPAPPKKMLQFNPKTGTIGSPPKPREPKSSKKQIKPEDTTEDTPTPTRRGKRRSKRIATINYGLDDASRTRIGAKIDAILNEPTTSSPKRKTRPRTSLREQKKAQLPGAKASDNTVKKDTHPFFTGNAKKATVDPSPAPASEAVKMKAAPAPTRPRIFSSTPCSPRKPRQQAPSVPFPQFGMRSLGLKTPGACHPAWPSKGMVHVRGDDSEPVPSLPSEQKIAARKSKGNTTQINNAESLLNNFAAGLEIPKILHTIKNADTENFQPPPAELRLPEKHFESGIKLEKRVLREVKHANHPALAQLRGSLVASLSAFDRYTCEGTCWAQKYTPKSAVEVLQFGKEAFLLRDWLEAMKVLSVDTGEVRVKPAKPPKKKRKKNKDDFIVDSDEEADNMDEVSDPEEEDWSPDRRGIKKTVIRTGDNAAKDSKNPGRLTNTVVISGPHGCGKTSTVYAIAKELDFEVFEINSGSRRSGKDILEKIGDMTRNHLVQHDQSEASAVAIDEEEVAEDIKSGKQATMNSFFKPKATQQPVKPKPVRETPAPVKTESKKVSPKSQKQSLILLDEVDILYEEDKQFWNTVITLIAQSKRPFIMTCNDENLVPLQALSLHGIFRFSAPPGDLAVDRLLMIAACEGHALRRDAVAALYEARQRDLRACLMDLNCWCQVAVGASRGGIDWLLPRWPKGCDLDEDGNVVRVISQDTYVQGMGWLGHGVVAGQEAEYGKKEQELLQEVHDFWQMDLGDWHDSLDLPSWAGSSGTNQDRVSLLKSYENFTDAMSFADLSAMSLATSVRESIDCTLPEMTNKAREDYIFGLQLLDAPVRSTYDPLATSLPITLKCLTRRNLQASMVDKPSQLNALDESNAISQIRHNTSAARKLTALTRDDLSVAFDILAISEKEANSTSNYLDPSVFDGTLRNITVDVAPYVRSIVSFERELQKQRQKLSGLLSQGGTKRARKTRAAHAALEGGSRSTVRREKWFDADLNGLLVMQTAGEGWADAVEEEDTVSSSASPVDSSARMARARRLIVDGGDDDDSGSSGMDAE